MSQASDPSSGAAAVTKSDTTILENVKALWIGGAGDVAVQFKVGGATITFKGCGAGTVLPIKVARVMAATTATDIVTFF